MLTWKSRIDAFTVGQELGVQGPDLKDDTVIYIRRTPHPVIVTIGDNRDCIRVLLYSYYTTITGWGGPPKIYTIGDSQPAGAPYTPGKRLFVLRLLHKHMNELLWLNLMPYGG